jgi:hypothetical protein
VRTVLLKPLHEPHGLLAVADDARLRRKSCLPTRLEKANETRVREQKTKVRLVAAKLATQRREKFSDILMEKAAARRNRNAVASETAIGTSIATAECPPRTCRARRSASA